jgi:glycosyltransferase involved in cell wall biosynthesis
MKLLVLSSSFPYPIDAGRKVVLAGFLDYAVATLGAGQVALLCVASPPAETEAARLAPCRVIFCAPAPAIMRGALVVLHSLLLRRRAIQEMLTAAPDVRRQITRLFEDFVPDVILVDTIRMVHHLPPLRRLRRTVLYLDDLYSLRYQRMLSATKDDPEAGFDSIGTFDRFIPSPVRGLIRGRAVQRRLLALESAILARREISMPRKFDQVLLLNPSEAASLSRSTGASNVSAVKPFLRRWPADEKPKRVFIGEATFLFLGNLGVPANAYGLSLFLRRGMPSFLAQIPTGRLIVVGIGAGRELRALGECFGEHVSFAGYVENLDGLCGTAAAMVVPLVFGTGLKIKVIEAMARGLPMISTSCGVEGLDLQPGIDFLLEDDPAKFADAMVRLLEPAFNAEVSRQILRRYRERFAPEAVGPSYHVALFGGSSAAEDPGRRPHRPT